MDTPPTVPPTFWAHPSIQAALSQQHMGKLIAAYRHHPHHGAPLRQREVAGWANISQVQLSRIETGPPIKHVDRLIHWATLLQIPAGLLWFRLPGQQHTPVDRPPPISLPTTSPFRLVRVGATARPLDAAQAFRTVDSHLGGGHLYSEVLTYLHTTVGPQLFDHDPSTDHAVYASAAGLTEMAGWMSHDAGNDPQALRHFTAALNLSRLGRDRQLHVHILASLAHLALHNHRPDLALRHAYTGETELSKGPRHPELAARLYAMQARAAALQQRPRDAHHLLDRAATALTTSPTAPLSPWASRFDEAALASEATRCLHHINDHTGAAAQAERILALRPAGRARARAFGQLALAEALISQRDLERACTITHTVAATCATVGSYLLLRRLTDIHQQLLPFRSATVVRETLDSLTSTIATRERTWTQPHTHHGQSP